MVESLELLFLHGNAFAPSEFLASGDRLLQFVRFVVGVTPNYPRFSGRLGATDPFGGMNQKFRFGAGGKDKDRQNKGNSLLHSPNNFMAIPVRSSTSFNINILYSRQGQFTLFSSFFP